MEEFQTIKEAVSAEIVEKKSKFIANIFPVQSLEEAEEARKEIRKKYHDAKHHVFAYCIELGKDGTAIKYNEDGEPQGTAGAPILNILTTNNLSNIMVIVTRYFGGILLGTGGLVRAYTEATQKALEKAETIKMVEGYEVKITLPYDKIEQLEYFCRKHKIRIVNKNYLEMIELNIELSESQKKMWEENDVTKDQIFENIEEKWVKWEN